MDFHSFPSCEGSLIRLLITCWLLVLYDGLGGLHGQGLATHLAGWVASVA